MRKIDDIKMQQCACRFHYWRQQNHKACSKCDGRGVSSACNAATGTPITIIMPCPSDPNN
jgi:hypothetical protein